MCSCRHTDAWRCAVERNITTVTCHCDCHRRLDLTVPPKPRPSQYELALNDWRGMTLDIAWHPIYKYIEGTDGKEVRVMHFAQDLNGEDQPPFSGWFYRVGSERDGFFAGFHPTRWRLIV